MFARLWWKEARQFGPIWLLLVLVAGATQWLVLYYEGIAARGGALIVLAVAWTALYAIAVGSTAFAGEREAGTLDLLDALPVGRRVLWRGKASFALVSTLALGIVLAAIAAISTDRWHPEGLGWITLPLGGAALLCMALGWGLLWSAVSTNALLAAALSVVCTVLALKFVLDVVSGHATLWFDEVQRQGFGRTTPWQLGLAALTIAGSARVMARRPRPSDDDPLWRRWARKLPRWTPQFRRSAEVVVRAEAPARPAGLRQPLLPELRVLSWQAVREFLPTWRLLAAVGLGLPLLLFLVERGIDWWIPILLAGLAGLVAGVQVFHLESQRLTQRFLAHHGARAGLVWLVKLGFGAVGLLAIWVGIAALFVFIPPIAPLPQSRSLVFAVLVLVIPTFPCGLLCGMAVRRALTAGVVAVLATLLVGFPLNVLAVMSMLPWPGIVLVLLAPAAITWAWRHDWMFERPAPGRWVRLGLLIAGVIGAASAGFIAYRLRGVPPSAPIPAPAGWNAAVPPAENALPRYEEALRRLRSVSSGGAMAAAMHPEAGGSAPVPVDMEAIRQVLAGPVAELRAASVLPRSVGPSSAAAPLFPSLSGAELVQQAAWYVSLEARDRLNRGDLDTAWDDVMALFRMSRQAAAAAPVERRIAALAIERPALGLAMEWSAAPGQTAARVRAALQAYLALPPMPPLAESLKAEAQLFEQSLALPTDKLFDVLVNAHGSPPLFRLITWPWEIVRTRNLGRLAFANAIDQAEQEPWRREYIEYLSRDPRGQIVSGGELDMATSDSVPPHTILGPLPEDSDPRMLPSFRRRSELNWAYNTTPLAQLLLPNVAAPFFWDDMNEIGRRAMVIYLALRVYQLEHNGRLPDDLATFHSPDLPTLPLDPFRPRAFGYAVAQPEGFYVPASEVLEFMKRAHQPEPMVGRRLLYSIGPDRVDQAGSMLAGTSKTGAQGDIVFPLPPEGTESAPPPEGPDDDPLDEAP